MTCITYSNGLLMTDTQTTEFDSVEQRKAMFDAFLASGNQEYIDDVNLMMSHPTWNKDKYMFNYEHGKFIEVNNPLLTVNGKQVKIIGHAGNGGLVAHIDKYAHKANSITELVNLVNQYVDDQLNEVMNAYGLELSPELIAKVDVGLMLVTEDGALAILGSYLKEEDWYWHAKDTNGVIGIGSGFTQVVGDDVIKTNPDDVKTHCYIGNMEQSRIHLLAANSDPMTNSVLVEFRV